MTFDDAPSPPASLEPATPGNGDADDAAGCSVVIPTYNRLPQLLRTLDHLARQDVQDLEVVVVDDGSSDGTMAALQAYHAGGPFRLTLIGQANAGPAAARNRGIAAATRPVTILIGDDTYPAPDFVRRHRQHHQRDTAESSVAIGRTRWYEDETPATPLMRWLDSEGLQFHFGELLAGTAPCWRHFYTSNLSAKTALLRDNPFHEDFPAAAMEDIELGYRLEQTRGLRMTFLPEAVVAHDHSTTYRQSCRRMVTAGAGGHAAGLIWPLFRQAEVKGVKRVLQAVLVQSNAPLALLAWTGDLAQRWRCPNALMAWILRLHAKVGYWRAARDMAERPKKGPELAPRPSRPQEEPLRNQ